MAEVFLDANVILRHLLQDHPEQSPRATAYIQRIENGEVQARLTETVIFEVVFTLDRSYKRPRPEISATLLALLSLPGLALADRAVTLDALRDFADRNVPYGDALHVAQMRHLGITEIATFDRDFDRFPGIRRVEP